MSEHVISIVAALIRDEAGAVVAGTQARYVSVHAAGRQARCWRERMSRL